MWTGGFDRAERTVWVEARVHGPRGDVNCYFIVDTGSTFSILNHEVAYKVGYGAHMGTRVSNILGVGSGRESGYRLPIRRLEVMGLDLSHIELACHDLPDEVGGLVGMDLIDGHVLTIDAKQGVVGLAD